MSDKLIVTVDAQIAALVPRFLVNRAADVETMRAALASADFEAIRAVGHRMKGAGGGYGFAEISRLGTAIEESALRHDAAAITGHVASLAEYLGRVEIKFADEQ